MQKSNIAWTHNTWNPWVGCDKVAPECAKCYIGREIRKQTDWQDRSKPKRKSWGEVYLTRTWNDPFNWNRKLMGTDHAKRVFTCSLSDFFHHKVDARCIAQASDVIGLPQHHNVANALCFRKRAALPNETHIWWQYNWREIAWHAIRSTPHLVYLILTKRPERILKTLPWDWDNGMNYPNVWLGTSVGANQSLSKLDSLRKVPIHPEAVRFVSCEPLLEDISERINLDGIGWVIAGGESGTKPEYLWDPAADWRKELIGEEGHRLMKNQWAWNLYMKSMYAGIPFFFKQASATRSEQGADSLGEIIHQMPEPPKGFQWMPTEVEAPTPLVVL